MILIYSTVVMVQYIHNVEILQYAISCFQGFLFSLRVKDKTSLLLSDRYNFWFWNKKYFMNKNSWHSILSDTILEPRDHLETFCQKPDLRAVMGGLTFAVEQYFDSKKRLNKFSVFFATYWNAFYHSSLNQCLLSTRILIATNFTFNGSGGRLAHFSHQPSPKQCLL